MWRYVFVLVLLAGAAPLVPGLIETRLATLQDEGPDAAEATRETGPRTHRISVDRSGHYVADAYLNGRAIDMLVDTGATLTVLPVSVAEDIGIHLRPSDFDMPIGTANGRIYGAGAVIDRLRIGAIRLRNVEAVVLSDERLSSPLLGMSVLGQLKRFDFSSGTLVLVQ